MSSSKMARIRTSNIKKSKKVKFHCEVLTGNFYRNLYFRYFRLSQNFFKTLIQRKKSKKEKEARLNIIDQNEPGPSRSTEQNESTQAVPVRTVSFLGIFMWKKIIFSFHFIF